MAIRLLKRIDQGIEKGSSALLLLSFSLMLLFSVLVIILRLFNSSFDWFEPLIRHLVLLSTFLGGVLATGRGGHISVDILSKYLESKNMTTQKLMVGRIIYLVSFLVVVGITYACLEFMKVELKYGKVSFLGIHSGALVGIIPFGFGLIAIRFLFLFIFSLFPEGGKR